MEVEKEEIHCLDDVVEVLDFPPADLKAQKVSQISRSVPDFGLIESSEPEEEDGGAAGAGIISGTVTKADGLFWHPAPENDGVDSGENGELDDQLSEEDVEEEEREILEAPVGVNDNGRDGSEGFEGGAVSSGTVKDVELVENLQRLVIKEVAEDIGEPGAVGGVLEDETIASPDELELPLSVILKSPLNLNLDRGLNPNREYPVSIDEDDTETEVTSSTTVSIGAQSDPNAVEVPVDAILKVIKVNLKIPHLALKAPKPPTIPPSKDTSILQQGKPMAIKDNKNDGANSRGKQEDLKSPRVTRARAKMLTGQRSSGEDACSCSRNREGPCPECKSNHLKTTSRGKKVTTDQKSKGGDGDEEEGVYVIKKILHHFYEPQRDMWWYYVTWKGYGKKEDQWIPASNILDKEFLKAYWEKQEKSDAT